MAVAALPGSTATPRAKGNLCGAAVGGAPACSATDCGNDAGCTTMLYNHVEGDTSFNCFSYSGVCSLRPNDFMNTNPNNCKGDTLYLWDEPDDGIGWAVNSWRSYVQKYGAELNEFRNRGGVVTNPLWRSPCGTKNIQFLEQCGELCTDPTNNGYIGALVGNYFANTGDTAEGGADWNIHTDMREATTKFPDLPVYVTNWCTSNCKDADCQYKSMKASKKMLDIGWRVYWFATLDCVNKDCFSNPERTNQRLSDMGPNGITMGQEWKKICDAYPHSGPSPGPSPGPTPGPTPGGECKSFCESDRSQHQVEGCTPGTDQCRHCSGNMNDSLARDCGGCSYCHSATYPCESFCADDRFSEPGREARHCSGNMQKDCGGCNYCSNRSNSARSEL